MVIKVVLSCVKGKVKQNKMKTEEKNSLGADKNWNHDRSEQSWVNNSDWIRRSCFEVEAEECSLCPFCGNSDLTSF